MVWRHDKRESEGILASWSSLRAFVGPLYPGEPYLGDEDRCNGLSYKPSKTEQCPHCGQTK